MSTILIISSDADGIVAIEHAAAECGYQVRVVSNFTAGTEWLAQKAAKVIMIDESFGQQQTIRFFESAWKVDPLVEGGIFNFNEVSESPWEALLIGASMFSGPDGPEAFKKMLTRLNLSLPPASLDNLGVLVVDDLDAPRDILCAYIHALGFDGVNGVASVDQALAELKQNGGKYFCVLSDIAMPQKSGINLLREIRMIEGLTLMPVIICTAYPTTENLVRSIIEGATGFLVKPPKKPMLRAELEKAQRFFRTEKDPRLCPAHLAGKFEEAMTRRGIL